MKTTIFWFRRDLRLYDNHGLYKALISDIPVLPIFIFDVNILDELSRDDPRVTFIYDVLEDLNNDLITLGSSLLVLKGDPVAVWSELMNKYEIDSVFTNHDYEPYATKRDNDVAEILKSQGINFNTFKDHVIFERQEVLSASNKVYTVFTPYKRKWLDQFKTEFVDKLKKQKSIYPSEDHLSGFIRMTPQKLPSLADLGFNRSKIDIPSREVSRGLIKDYGETRNFPGNEKSTSRLGIHFRFGTISIREKAISAYSLSEVYLSELIWRDFYAQILANFPQVIGNAFKPKYDNIQWRQSDEDFKKWKEGQTGYPLVDAGMRELNKTGYMHNRVRMITASFLTKHLLLDWRLGEAYFAEKLLDFDLASNNGGWQWAAGSGTDAAPYFRIFNPATQMEKFDKERKYVKKWVPEYGTDSYVKPMVDHKFARERCLMAYKNALNEG